MNKKHSQFIIHDALLDYSNHYEPLNIIIVEVLKHKISSLKKC